MDKILCAVIIVLIVLIVFSWSQPTCSGTSEKFTILTDLKGVYTLQPMFDSKIVANRAVTLQVIPQRPNNPNFLLLTINYANGKSNSVQTNLNVGNIFSYMNDYSNVQYLTNPANLQYDLHVDTGLFRAMTVVMDGKQMKNQLLSYKISSRIA